MKPLVFQIADPIKMRSVFKGYVVIYNENKKDKVWCAGVHNTYGKAERAAKKLLKELKKK